jgi:hypothetical protein
MYICSLVSRWFQRDESRSSVTIESRFFHATHQLGWGYAVGFREPNDSPESRTLYPPLDRAQLGSIDAELNVNIKLGKACGFPNLAQHTSKSLFRT